MAPAAVPAGGGRVDGVGQDSHTGHSTPHHTAAAAVAAGHTGAPLYPVVSEDYRFKKTTKALNTQHKTIIPLGHFSPFESVNPINW